MGVLAEIRYRNYYLSLLRKPIFHFDVYTQGRLPDESYGLCGRPLSCRWLAQLQSILCLTLDILVSVRHDIIYENDQQ